MDAEPLANVVSESELASVRRETERKARPVSGWADMWFWLTGGLGVFGCLSIPRMYWPDSEATQWVVALIAVLIWVLGCRVSGLFDKSYDFPERKFASLKRFFSGGIGVTAFAGLVSLHNGPTRLTRGNLAAAAVIFLFGGFVKAGSSPRPAQTP